MDITPSERQLLIAAYEVKRSARRDPSRKDPSQEDLRKMAASLFDDKLLDLTSAFETLPMRGWLMFDDENKSYTLAGQGVELASELDLEFSQESFGEWMVTSEESPTYAEFCERTYGTRLIQFNMVDHEQLDKLLEVLQLTSQHRVVDLGCGIGTLSEYLSDRTGAHVTGVDFADAAICRAAERTSAKRDRLAFQVGNLNCLNLPRHSFDAAVVFDTLYFVDDLDQVVGDILSLLVPGGQLGAFYSELRGKSDPADILEAANTLLGKALKRHGCDFTTWDFTENERRYWEASKRAADDLKVAFEAEGNHQLWKSRDEEISVSLERLESKSTSRYLYHLRV